MPKFPEITPDQTLGILKESADLGFAKTVGLARRIWLRSSGGDWDRCTSLDPTHTIYDTETLFSLIKEFSPNLQEKPTLSSTLSPRSP